MWGDVVVVLVCLCMSSFFLILSYVHCGALYMYRKVPSEHPPPFLSTRTIKSMGIGGSKYMCTWYCPRIEHADGPYVSDLKIKGGEGGYTSSGGRSNSTLRMRYIHVYITTCTCMCMQVTISTRL